MEEQRFNEEEQVIECLRKCYISMAAGDFEDLNAIYKDMGTKINSLQHVLDYNIPIAVTLSGRFKRILKRLLRKTRKIILKPYLDKMLEVQKESYEFMGELLETLEEQQRLLREYERR